MTRTLSTAVVILTACAVPLSAQRPSRGPQDRRTSPSLSRAYQGDGPERTERFSRRLKIGRDGRFSLRNIAGDIVITGGSGDEVSIEAIKSTRGDASDLQRIEVDVQASGSRVDVRTTYPTNSFLGGGRIGRFNRVRVDYTVTVPASVEVDAKSVSGAVKVSGVQGTVRAESVSGNINTSGTPNVEIAKSISGIVDLRDIRSDGTVAATSISGSVRAVNVKARGLTVNTVSGDTTLTDVACDRVDARTISGGIEYSGTLAKNGRYDLNSHSGVIRLSLPDSTGFTLNATTFSGNVRSDLPMTLGGGTERGGRGGRERFGLGRSIQGTFKDGSAALTLRTFSGDIVVSKR